MIGNVQERTIRQHSASNSEVVLYSYAIGFVYLFFLVAVFTDIASAINYCSYYPKLFFSTPTGMLSFSPSLATLAYR